MERLKAFSVEKFTLGGSKFHIHGNSLCEIPTSSTVNTTWFVQFVRMAPSDLCKLIDLFIPTYVRLFHLLD